MILGLENGNRAKEGTSVTMRTNELLIHLVGVPAAAGLARTLTDQWLRKWDCFRIIDDALLVVGELVANAAKETPDREIRLRIGRDEAAVTVAVWDSSDRSPVHRAVTTITLEDLDISEESFDDNGGRGLPIVHALAVDCGYTPTPGGGKWVWASLGSGRDDLG